MKNSYLLLLLFHFLLCACEPVKSVAVRTAIHNPILPGYFADPSIIQLDSTYYIYATADPWGADFLSCWSSSDFVNWKFHSLNWPTKHDCTSKQSNENMVWAPSVIKKGDHYYMYVSVGSEVWCGIASHPLGPWKDALNGEPLIPFDLSRYYHVIDAEVFTDEDGRSYLYWGSGWNWVNGHCFVAELNDDMISFKEKPVEVTPTNYFEGPFMMKHMSKYYLTYSDGMTIDDTYKVRYAVGDSPYGPFVEAKNSPILTTDRDKNVFGPGHHAISYINNQPYIFYHKHRLPYQKGTAYRQLCLDSLLFDDGLICRINPSDSIDNPLSKKMLKQEIKVAQVSASSCKSKEYSADNVIDFSYQTLWTPNKEDSNPWIELAFSEEVRSSRIDIMFEYPWKDYSFSCEISLDGKKWTSYYEHRENGMVGSPFIISEPARMKYMRFNVSPSTGIWEIKIYE